LRNFVSAMMTPLLEVKIVSNRSTSSSGSNSLFVILRLEKSPAGFLTSFEMQE